MIILYCLLPVSGGGSGIHGIVPPPITSFLDIFSLLSRSTASIYAANHHTESGLIEKLDEKKIAAILQNIEKSEWVEPTPIQVK